MNALSDLYLEMSLLTPGRLYLLELPRTLRRPVLNELIARLAMRGEVQVLVAGNHFDAHGIARLLRRQTETITPALKRIRLARAFTCYQVHALIRQAEIALPTVVTDLLETFSDENVPLEERRALLTECVQRLRWLSRGREVLVSTAPPHATTPMAGGAQTAVQEQWRDYLRASADRVWSLELPLAQPLQLSLFGGE